jgi:hypothetical protein
MQVREAVGGAANMSQALRRLVLPPAGGNHRSLKKLIAFYGLSTDHFERSRTTRRPSMSLILDHINGIATDNRLENLRIVCPNCAATLETHCGRKLRLEREPRTCLHCGSEFVPKYPTHRYCSQRCGIHSRGSRTPRPQSRKVPRPPQAQLLADLKYMSVLAVGRKYGVSDNAIRKWIRWYEGGAVGGLSPTIPP